jgi:hypothetical protein
LLDSPESENITQIPAEIKNTEPIGNKIYFTDKFFVARSLECITIIINPRKAALKIYGLMLIKIKEAKTNPKIFLTIFLLKINKQYPEATKRHDADKVYESFNMPLPQKNTEGTNKTDRAILDIFAEYISAITRYNFQMPKYVKVATKIVAQNKLLKLISAKIVDILTTKKL